MAINDRTMTGYAVEHGFITEKDAEKVKKYCADNQCGEDRAMLDCLSLNEKKLLEIYAGFNSMKFIADIDEIEIDEELISKCNSHTLAEFKMLPYEVGKDERIRVLVTSAKTLRIEDYLRTVFPGKRFEYILISEQDCAALQNPDGSSLKDFADNMDIEVSAGSAPEVYDISDDGSDSEIVNFVNSVFADAITRRASDIHIEPQEKYVRIRYRIDGGLIQAMRFNSAMAGRVINRIKTMADMDVNSNFEPQDGNIRLSIRHMPLDMRASVLPSEYGESVVLRILNKSAMTYNLNAIGMTDKNRKVYERMINCENGIILCTGPTGSGKSTTLYCTVSELNNEGVKIMTAEDPVEIHIDGIIQSAVSNRLTFDDTLKAQLRQDPNILLLGEIRDGETANTAITASNTGHLVLSTLHANSALASISRLRSKTMGLDSYNLGDTLRGIINQRLVRRLCDRCKEKYILEKGLPFADVFLKNGEASVEIYRAHEGGCRHCGGIGYRGRIGLHEILEIDSELGYMIMDDAPLKEIAEKAKESNRIHRLADDAADKVLMGLTSIDEVKKYIGIRV